MKHFESEMLQSRRNDDVYNLYVQKISRFYAKIIDNEKTRLQKHQKRDSKNEQKNSEYLNSKGS